MVSNKKCLEYASKITPDLLICGVQWKVIKIEQDIKNDIYGLCDHKNKIIYYSDEESLIHEYVHAWLYHNDNKNCGNEYAVMRITNMILNKTLYGGTKMRTKTEVITDTQYDTNGSILEDAVVKVFKCTEQISFEQEMKGDIPWVEVGEMKNSEYEEWLKNPYEISPKF